MDEKTTTIRANFGKANPNTKLAEINVRESLFMPEVAGLKYITVSGFHFMHAAANWAPPVMDLQPGAVWTAQWVIIEVGANGPAVTLSIQRSGNNLILSWPQGTLMQATDLGRQWSAVPGNPTSPLQVTPTEARMFYKVQVR